MKITGKILAGFFMPYGFSIWALTASGWMWTCLSRHPCLPRHSYLSVCPPWAAPYGRNIEISLIFRDFSKTEVLVTVITGDCWDCQSNEMCDFMRKYRETNGGKKILRQAHADKPDLGNSS